SHLGASSAVATDVEGGTIKRNDGHAAFVGDGKAFARLVECHRWRLGIVLQSPNDAAALTARTQLGPHMRYCASCKIDQLGMAVQGTHVVRPDREERPGRLVQLERTHTPPRADIVDGHAAGKETHRVT